MISKAIIAITIPAIAPGDSKEEDVMEFSPAAEAPFPAVRAGVCWFEEEDVVVGTAMPASAVFKELEAIVAAGLLEDPALALLVDS